MKIHIISETSFLMKSTGVHTAFMDHIELLKEKDDIEVVINNEGSGDVLHSHTYGLYYLWKGRNYKGRRVFTAHVIPESAKGSLPLLWLFMPLVKLSLKMAYSYADICIALSPMVKNAIIETGANTKIIQIYNPINVDKWKRTKENRRIGRELLGLTDTEFVILGVGQLEGRKGIDDFLDIADSFPSAKFVWAGGRPFGGLTEGIPRINARFRKAGNNVIHAGPIELKQMPYVYAAADLMLFPSYQENCPLAPIEAAACGMPVIFRDIEEYRRLYENPYLKAGNKKEFCEIITRMMADKDYYNSGLKISEQLLVQFDKEKIRSKLIKTYESLMSN